MVLYVWFDCLLKRGIAMGSIDRHRSIEKWPIDAGKAIDVVSLLFRCCNQRLLLIELLSSITDADADAPAADRSTDVVTAAGVLSTSGRASENHSSTRTRIGNRLTDCSLSICCFAAAAAVSVYCWSNSSVSLLLLLLLLLIDLSLLLLLLSHSLFSANNNSTTSKRRHSLAYMPNAASIVTLPELSSRAPLI